MRIKGEIKGQNIPDKFLESFFNEVLEVSPNINYSVISIIPSENSIDILNKHKAYEVKQMEDYILDARKGGHDSWVTGYEKILYWYKNKNYQTIIKLKCLEQLFGISLNNVLVKSQIKYLTDNNDDKNMRDISFKVDKDYIRAENVKKIWEELFRQFWQNYTKKFPTPVISEIWKDEDHPFFKIYSGHDGKSNIKEIIRERTYFLDSKDSWEVRMADLVGTILHRHRNRGRCNKIGEKMMSYLYEKNYSHIKLNEVGYY